MEIKNNQNTNIIYCMYCKEPIEFERDYIKSNKYNYHKDCWNLMKLNYNGFAFDE